MRNHPDPRITNYLATLALSFQGRIQFFQNRFSTILFCLFLGFLLANIFGTFLGALRNLGAWDGFVIFGVVILVELVSYATYRLAKHQFMGILSSQSTESRNSFWRLANNFKVGLLLGFFVEAFKVGS